MSVIDLEADPPRAIDHITVGDGPEGLAISPDGKLAVVPLLQGSAPPFANKWFFHEKGAIAILKIEGKKVSLAGTVETGRFPEGVGFSRDGKHLFVGDLADNQISVFKVGGHHPDPGGENRSSGLSGFAADAGALAGRALV
ncbi:MAG: hypothetical protein VCA73_03515 [Roseibacillus sp.]